jgi:hypothetical protein
MPSLLPPLPRRPRARERKTTTIGFTNRNDQTVISKTDKPGTDYCQVVYVLKCATCGYEHGANGSDIWQRRCPNHDQKSRGEDLMLRA